MTDRPTEFSAARMGLVILLALAALAVIAWQMGFLASGAGEDARTVYKAGVRDESGGELIVSDPAAPRIEDQTLPETAMTPVPPEDDARPARTEPGTK